MSSNAEAQKRPSPLLKAKAVIPTVWALAEILDWPIRQGQTSALAWWRGERGASLAIYAGGSRWTDHGGKGRHGDQVDLLATVVGLDLRSACRLFIDIARCVSDGGVLPAVPVIPPVSRGHRPLQPGRLSLSWRRGTQKEHCQLAELRRFPNPSAFLHLTEIGHLLFGEIIDGGKSVPAWLITDSTRYAAQVRRLDGALLEKGQKAKTLYGFRATWPIGLADAQAAHTIFVTEGGPDLAAMWHHLLANKAKGYAAVALFGAKAMPAPEAQCYVAGKHIVLCPHNDEAGDEAAENWAEAFQKFGAASIKRFPIPNTTGAPGFEPVKDLNDMLSNGLFEATSTQTT